VFPVMIAEAIVGFSSFKLFILVAGIVYSISEEVKGKKNDN